MLNSIPKHKKLELVNIAMQHYAKSDMIVIDTPDMGLGIVAN